MWGRTVVPAIPTSAAPTPATSAAKMTQPPGEQQSKRQRIDEPIIIKPKSSTPYQPSKPAGNLCLGLPAVKVNISHSRRKPRVLLLCAGPNSRELSLFKLLCKAGYEVDNYDLVNGDGNDIADTAVFDKILRAVQAKEYEAAFASPRNMPGGPRRYGGLKGGTGTD